ncbi:MAG TPA: hypothetical protein VFT05_14380 [Burkholderiaceae bacterium]|jgi:hypothetical protein|nr:hypothetical protein [Burkholderiaceae bacterium]
MMSILASDTMPMMDEYQFYQLLAGPAPVWVDIVRLGPYFAPYVPATGVAGRAAPYGAIVRGHSDVLAAETVEGVRRLLLDIADGSPRLRINDAAVRDV